MRSCAADGHALDEYLVPARAAVLVPAVPLDAQLLARDRALRALIASSGRVGRLAGAERADDRACGISSRCSRSCAGLGVDVDDRAGVDVVHEDRVLGGVEDRAVARLRCAQRLVGAHALGDVLRRSRMRHGVEGAAQTAELVAPAQAAARREIARGELLGGVHQLRRAARQQEMEHQPHGQREGGHPSRPVERLLQDLRARFGLVALRDRRRGTGCRCATGRSSSRVAAHQDAGVAEQRVAAGDRRSARRGVRGSPRRPASRSNCGSTSAIGCPSQARRVAAMTALLVVGQRDEDDSRGCARAPRSRAARPPGRP